MNVSMAFRDPRSEAGFALIEVIVAAAVLAIVALAVLSGHRRRDQRLRP